MTDRLRALFDPKSVAVVGASDDPRKWGNWLGVRALRGADRRAVYLVNQRSRTVLGRRAYPSVAELPEPPELAAIAVPAAGFETAVDEALAAGAVALVGISAGLGELGGASRARQEAVVERVRAAGAVLLGPNCLGLFDAATGLDLTSNDLPAGRIGLISQSGNLALEVARRAGVVGLGFDRFVSLGNQADLAAATSLPSFGAADLDAIAVYCEDFHDGRAFARAAAEVAARRPVVVLAAGESAAGARAAASHTGALTSHATAVAAALEAAGVEQVASPRELVDLLQALAARGRVRGRRIAVLADGGGHGAVAADLADRIGLRVPRLPRTLSARLAAGLPPTATTTNPVDLAGGGEQDPAYFARATTRLLASSGIDAVLLTGYFGGYAEYAPELGVAEVAAAEAIAAEVARSGKAVVVQTMYPQAPVAAALRSGGVPVYDAIEGALAVIARLADRSLRRARPLVPDLPRPADPVPASGYLAARDLLASGGVPVPPARLVESAADAVSAARELGFPVALKTLAAEHKSDRGGVLLDLPDADAVRAAFRQVVRLGPRAVVERHLPIEHGVELLAGVWWDARFGPVLVLGIGGVYAEVLADTAAVLAPTTPARAARVLRRLRGAALLTGARGRPAVDLDAAAETVARLSVLGARHPELEALEANPLLVRPDGAVALDARMVPRAGTARRFRASARRDTGGGRSAAHRRPDRGRDDGEAR